MASVGPVGVTTSAEITRGGSDGFWDNDGNLYLSGAGATPLFNPGSGGYSNFLAATDFDFSAIPDGSTIDGIEVVWTLQDIFDSGEFADESSYLTKDGSASVGSNLATSTTVPGSSTPFTYGGASSLWGTTWTTAEIKSSNFGALFAFSAVSGSPLAYAIYCEITVYYTAPGNPPPCAFIGLTKQFGALGDLVSMLKNTAGQKIGSQMLTIADGTPFTGGVTVYVTGDGGTQALGSVGSGVCAHEGEGYHTYAPAQAETNYDLIGFTFKGTGAYNQTVQVGTQSASLDAAGVRAAVGLASANLDTQLSTIDTVVDSILVDTAEIGSAGAGLTALATAANLATAAGYIDTEVAAIKAKTDQFVFTVANQVDANALSGGGGGGGLDAAATRAALGLASANLDTQIATLATASNLATVAGYLDTEIAAILADTNELQTDWVDGGRLDLILDARASQTSVNTIDGIVDDILVDTAEIGTAGAGLTALASAANLATVDTVVDAIKVKTDQFVFTVANQVDANTLTGGGTGLSSDVSAIKAKTDNLPSDPADASVVAGLIAAVETKVDTIDGIVDAILVDTAEIGTAGAGLTALASAANLATVDTVVDAIKVKTDQLTFTVANQVDANALTATGDTVCQADICVRTTAGVDADIVAWLEQGGQRVALASGDVTVRVTEKSGSDLFTVTSSSPNADGVFQMSKHLPNFTSDRIYLVEVEIDDGVDTWVTEHSFKPIG